MTYPDRADQFVRAYHEIDTRIIKLQAQLEHEVALKAQADALFKAFLGDAVVEPVADEPVIISEPAPVIVAPIDEPVIVGEPDLDDMEENDFALFSALHEASRDHPGEWLTDCQLFKLAQPHGFALKRPSVSNRMAHSPKSLVKRYPGVIEEQAKPLSWRMIVADDPEPDTDDETVAMKLDLTARKRTSAAQRTQNRNRSFLPLAYFVLPDLPWSFSTGHDLDRIYRSHPFFDMLTANLGDGWQITGGFSSKSASIYINSQKDSDALLASGLVTRRANLLCLDLSMFHAELEAMENKWKLNAQKAQDSSKRAPKKARTVFRDNDLIARLEESEWEPIKLPPLRRMGFFGNPTVERVDPIDDKKIITSGPITTCLAQHNNLDAVWTNTAHDWLITSPEIREGSSYGPTVISDAIVWVHPDDAFLVRLAIA